MLHIHTRGRLQSLQQYTDKHAIVALLPSKVIGCDFSGTVTSLGSAVHSSSFAPRRRHHPRLPLFPNWRICRTPRRKCESVFQGP
jgi:hypothetical protein